MRICRSAAKLWLVDWTMTSPVTWTADQVTSCMTTNATLAAPSDRHRHYAQYKLIVDVYVISTLCVVGFVGNVLSFGVLCSSRHERRGTTTCLLQTLAVVDTAYLVTCLIIHPIKVQLTPLSWLRFSRNRKAVETCNLVETMIWTCVTRRANFRSKG